MIRTSPAYKALRASEGIALSLKERNALVKKLKAEGFRQVRGSTRGFTALGSESLLILVIVSRPRKSSTTYEIDIKEAKSHNDLLKIANQVSRDMIFA